MEGCPKLPMFSYDLKIARESSNFSQVIKKLIRVSVLQIMTHHIEANENLDFSYNIMKTPRISIAKLKHSLNSETLPAFTSKVQILNWLWTT